MPRDPEEHREQARRTGMSNKGRKRPDSSERMRKVGQDTKKSKEKTESIKQDAYRKPSYTNPILLAYRIAKYFQKMDSIEWENTTGKHTGKPCTDTGISLAIGVSHNTMKDMLNGNLDHFITDQQDGQIRLSREGVQSKTIHEIEPELLPYVLHLLGNSDYAFDKEPLVLDKETLDALQEWGKQVYFSEIIQRALQVTEQQREYRLYDNGRTADIFSVKSKDGWKDDTVIINRREMISSAEARELLEKVYTLPQIED